MGGIIINRKNSYTINGRKKRRCHEDCCTWRSSCWKNIDLAPLRQQRVQCCVDEHSRCKFPCQEGPSWREISQSEHLGHGWAGEVPCLGKELLSGRIRCASRLRRD